MPMINWLIIVILFTKTFLNVVIQESTEAVNKVFNMQLPKESPCSTFFCYNLVFSFFYYF
jgi:hypothetical protein